MSSGGVSEGGSSSSMSSMSQSQIGQRSWEMANNMESVNSADEIYQYDRKQQQDILQAKPWEKEWVELSDTALAEYGIYCRLHVNNGNLFLLVLQEDTQ